LFEDGRQITKGHSLAYRKIEANRQVEGHLIQFRKNNTKSRCLNLGHRKIRKGASTSVEEEGRNFRIVEEDERKKGIQIIQTTEERRVKKGKLDAIEDFKRRERYF